MCSQAEKGSIAPGHPNTLHHPISLWYPLQTKFFMWKVSSTASSSTTAKGVTAMIVACIFQTLSTARRLLVWVVCLYVYARSCQCAYGSQKRELEVLLCHTLSFSLVTRSLTELVARRGMSKLEWSSCLHSLQLWGYNQLHLVFLYMGSGDLNTGPHVCTERVVFSTKMKSSGIRELTQYIYKSNYRLMIVFLDNTYAKWIKI